MLLWPDSDNLVFFIKHYCIYFDFTTLLAVCIHGLGATVNISLSL